MNFIMFMIPFRISVMNLRVPWHNDEMNFTRSFSDAFIIFMLFSPNPEIKSENSFNKKITPFLYDTKYYNDKEEKNQSFPVLFTLQL